jgi:hypothetical protein
MRFPRSRNAGQDHEEEKIKILPGFDEMDKKIEQQFSGELQ